METQWAVSAATERITLGPQNRGEVTFTVTNPGAARDVAVLDVVPGDGAEQSWFSVAEPQRRLEGGASATYLVTIVVPPQAPVQTYSLQARVSSAGSPPEETSRLSGRVDFEVAPAVKPPRPWWPYAVAAALVIIVLLAVGWLVFGRGGSTPTAGPSPTASAVPRPRPSFICGLKCEGIRKIPVTVLAPAAPALIPSDCQSYDPATLSILSAGASGFQVVDGGSVLFTLDTKADAQDAVALAKRYGELCYLGRDDPLPNHHVWQYWHKPTGASTQISQSDHSFCLPYNNKDLTIVADGGSWTVKSKEKDGESSFGPFGLLQEAQNMQRLAAAFTSVCAVGYDFTRPQSLYVTYWQ